MAVWTVKRAVDDAAGRRYIQRQGTLSEKGRIMSVTLSIKGLPEDVAAKLRRRAAEHQRSPEGEALAILEASLTDERCITIGELHAKVQAMGLRSPAESVAMLREDRYGSHRR